MNASKVIPVTAMVLRPHFNDMEFKLRPGMITLTWTSMNIDTYKAQVGDVRASVLHVWDSKGLPSACLATPILQGLINIKTERGIFFAAIRKLWFVNLESLVTPYL